MKLFASACVEGSKLWLMNGYPYLVMIDPDERFEATLRKTLGEMLYQYRLSRLSTGRDGRIRISRILKPAVPSCPDLICLPNWVPDQQGINQIRDLKTQPMLDKTPILAWLTAEQWVQTRRKGLPANMYLLRPEDPQAFQSQLYYVLTVWLALSCFPMQSQLFRNPLPWAPEKEFPYPPQAA